jgi:hypothetical protein
VISDGLSQGAQFISHAFHLATIVANAKISLIEDTKLGVDLQDTGLTVTEELGLIADMSPTNLPMKLQVTNLIW